ncbi:hypothetical protein LV84_00076 [Algoriphagus ratkowskyi]|uniref:Uncharacterized protein n=1 Tax=Algoriphagus ratkowskyi TaxID=57028 RepID=A0A2W7RJR0_9BACT|nr:hypothetical protein LV84_00076 [Algoriphagus ratkowskyi]
MFNFILQGLFVNINLTLINMGGSFMVISGKGDIQPSYLENGLYFLLRLVANLYLLVVAMISWNIYRINKCLPLKYALKINFLK